MKVAKDYSHVPRRYYKPEFEDCLVCGTRLRRSHRLWNKYIHQLCGTIYGVSMGYRCANDTCSSEMIYRSAEAESLSLKYYSFGMDVIARIGELRFDRNRTVGEIHTELSPHLSISEREVQYLIETYLVLVSGIKQDTCYLDTVLSSEGIILSIDGIQPEKGNEVLYILRDVLSGEVLHAENLLSSDAASIEGLLQSVIDLGYPILGVVSDGQHSIRLAVQQLLPEIPYQLCHYHYLAGISQSLRDRDRKLKTKLKQGIRDIRSVERRIEKLQASEEKAVLQDLAMAVRASALEPSCYPFECGGTRVYEHLVQLENTLQSCLEQQPHPLLSRLKEIVRRYQSYQETYQQVQLLLTLVTRISTLIDREHFTEDDELKRQQRVLGYLGYVTKLTRAYPELADPLEAIIKLTKSFLPGLFAYVHCPPLPVTNNDLEVFHRRVKTQHRRRTGRRSSHDYIIRYGRFAVFLLGQDCRHRIQELAYAKFRALKDQLQAVRSRYSKLYQLRHRRTEFLHQVQARWATLVPT
jgi:hypothetical protein